MDFALFSSSLKGNQSLSTSFYRTLPYLAGDAPVALPDAGRCHPALTVAAGTWTILRKTWSSDILLSFGGRVPSE